MEMGPTHTINYKTQDFAEESKAITGKGVDLIVDFVGKDHWEKNITSLAVDGRMVMLSLLSGKSSLIPFLMSLLTIKHKREGSKDRPRSYTL
jgi:NADPH:quinone reductase-like Zn-dependent oxidoreductase